MVKEEIIKTQMAHPIKDGVEFGVGLALTFIAFSVIWFVLEGIILVLMLT